MIDVFILLLVFVIGGLFGITIMACPSVSRPDE